VHKKRVQLATNATSFTIEVWPTVYQRSGRFDLVARVNDPTTTARTAFRSDDLLFHGEETGLHVRPASQPFGPAGASDLETQLAGSKTTLSLSPGFRFQDVFLRHDEIRVALDPTDLPPHHPGGDYAQVFVVRARNERQWHAVPRIGPDLTETVDVFKMKAGTLEASINSVWVDPDPADPLDMKCDVVIDFANGTNSLLGGGTAGAGGSSGGGTAVYDGVYDVGVDVIDKLNDVGFTLVDDPSDPGPYPVGRSQYDFVDAYDIPWGDYKDKKVDVRAVIAYPGQTAGTDVAVWGSTEKFPLIAILHGNHSVCLSGSCTCSAGNRIPNHKGYDYLLDLWASHGFIAVSIDGYDITGCPPDRFIERGALILEHLRRWLDWNNPAVTDPTFSGRYYDRVDVDKIGIAGHSRGGEGVAAAVQINRDLALGYHIISALTIAPTDYNWSTPPGGGPIEFLVEDLPLFNIMGSSDGDVVTSDGAQIWDRSMPDGHRAVKSQAFIYGADHNSWNTVWIDSRWNGFSDGIGNNRITAAQQQDTGRVYFTSWWMATLQGRSEMLAFHRGIIDSPKLAGIRTYWSYEAPDHVNVDHFEDTPQDKTKNSLGDLNSTNPAPVKWLESRLKPGDYDGSFFQDTKGMIFGWNVLTDYEIDIPSGNQDVTPYQFLHFRVCQIRDNLNPGGNQNFKVQIEDVNGVRNTVDVNSRAFAPIPVGYFSPAVGTRSMLASARIPLRAFTQNDSGVDLTRVTKVIVTFDNSGLLAFDDIQFTK
jgi:hypothetical protein